jgi:hypothetical protein
MIKRLLPAPLVTAAIAALALSGCGGGSTEATSAPASATTTPAAAATTTPAATATASKPASRTARTPTGTTLKIGQPAVVPYEDGTTKHKSNVEITPRSIVKASMADFANVQLEKAQKSATPYYVKVHAKNVGRGNLSNSDPAGYLSGVDDRGQRQNAVIFLGTFDACSHTSSPKSLKPGESYDTCQVYLIPKGGSLKGMVWVEYDQSRPDKQDVNWKH